MDVSELQDKVQAKYSRLTAKDATRHPTRRVPDFREQDGIRVQTFGRLLTDGEMEKPVDELAQALADEVVDFERSHIESVNGPYRTVARCFLKGHELPDVLTRPDGKVKFRHVFAAVDLTARAKEEASQAPITTGVQQGPPTPRTAPKTVERCDRCFAKLYLAERGNGSTSMACPNHGFQRMILTIPLDIEHYASLHPETVAAYAKWLGRGAPKKGWKPRFYERFLIYFGLLDAP